MASENVLPLRAGPAAEDAANGADNEEEYAPKDDPRYTRVKDGEYVAGLVSCEKVELYRSKRWKTVWRIVEGPEAGKLLLYYMPVIPEGRPPTRGYKMPGVYCVATGRRPPRDLWRRNPKSFLGGALFRVRTGKVKRDSQQNELPEPTRYSVIRSFVRRLDGVPRDCEVEA